MGGDSPYVNGTNTDVIDPNFFFVGPLLSENLGWFTVIFACLVVVTIAYEKFTEWLAEKVEEVDSGVYQGLLNAVYKELAILGTVSFVAILVIQIPWIEIPHSTHLIFEFAHILIFMVAIFYILQSALAARFTLFMRRQWYESEVRKRSDLVDAFKKIKAAWSAKIFGSAWLSQQMFHLHFFVSPLRLQLQYQILKFLFYNQNNINYRADFDFSLFLKENLIEHLENIVDISLETWAVVVVVLFVNFFAVGMSQAMNSHDCDNVLQFKLEESHGGGHRRQLAAVASSSCDSAAGNGVGELIFIAFGWAIVFGGAYILWKTKTIINRFMYKALSTTDLTDSNRLTTHFNTIQKIIDSLDGVNEMVGMSQDSIRSFQLRRATSLHDKMTQKSEHWIQREGHWKKYFPCGSPKCLHIMVEVLLVGVCFYQALFFLVFIGQVTRAVDHVKDNPGMQTAYLLMMILPVAIFQTIINPYVMRDYSVVNVLLEVPEKTIERYKVAKEKIKLKDEKFKSEVKRKFGERVQTYEAARALLRDFDTNEDEQLDFHEMRRFMHTKILQHGIDDAAFYTLFRELDTNSDGTVSFQEFYEAMFRKEAYSEDESARNRGGEVVGNLGGRTDSYLAQLPPVKPSLFAQEEKDAPYSNPIHERRKTMNRTEQEKLLNTFTSSDFRGQRQTSTCSPRTSDGITEETDEDLEKSISKTSRKAAKDQVENALANTNLDKKCASL